jgi:hypothetical protein
MGNLLDAATWFRKIGYNGDMNKMGPDDITNIHNKKVIYQAMLNDCDNDNKCYRGYKYYLDA